MREGCGALQGLSCSPRAGECVRQSCGPGRAGPAQLLACIPSLLGTAASRFGPFPVLPTHSADSLPAWSRFLCGRQVFSGRWRGRLCPAGALCVMNSSSISNEKNEVSVYGWI